MLEPGHVTYRTLTHGSHQDPTPFAATPAAGLVEIALRDPDAGRRLDALRECVDRAPDDDDTIAALVAALRGTDRELQTEAIELLLWSERDPRLLDAVAWVARSAGVHRDVRYDAITWIGDITEGQTDVLAGLAQADPDSDIRDHAITTLVEHRRDDPLAAAALMHVFLHDTDEANRCTALANLDLLGAQPIDESFMHLLLEHAQHDPSDGIQGLTVSTLVSHYIAVPAARSFLIGRAVRDRTWSIRREIVDHLLPAPAPADEEPTVALLLDRTANDPESRVRFGAAEALLQKPVASQAERVTQHFRELAQTTDQPMLRSTAIRLVAAYEDLSDAGHSSRWLLDQLAAAPDIGAKMAAVRGLGDVAGQDPAAVSALEAVATGDEFWRARQAALQELVGALPHTSERLAWLSERARHDAHWKVRQYALELIAVHWTEDPDATALLREREQADPDEDVRARAGRLAQGHLDDVPYLETLKGRQR